MEEEKKLDESESSDNSEKIEVKVTTAADATDSNSNNDVATDSETTEMPSVDRKIEIKTEDEHTDLKQDSSSSDSSESVKSEIEEPPVSQNDLVPPPAEDSTEINDGSVHEQVVQAAPQENPEVSNPDVIPNTATATDTAAVKQVVEVHPHRNNKKLAILITIFVGAILASIAVYVYMSANNNTKEADPAPSPSPQQSTEQSSKVDTEPATAQDVDATTGEVDQAIESLDDAGDFSDEQLSDESLGL